MIKDDEIAAMRNLRLVGQGDSLTPAEKELARAASIVELNLALARMMEQMRTGKIQPVETIKVPNLFGFGLAPSIELPVPMLESYMKSGKTAADAVKDFVTEKATKAGERVFWWVKVGSWITDNPGKTAAIAGGIAVVWLGAPLAVPLLLAKAGRRS